MNAIITLPCLARIHYNLWERITFKALASKDLCRNQRAGGFFPSEGLGMRLARTMYTKNVVYMYNFIPEAPKTRNSVEHDIDACRQIALPMQPLWPNLSC